MTIQHILLDIEGTTTSISFVHEVLFPYAKEHIEDFLQRKAGTPEAQEAIQAIRQQADEDLRDANNPFEAVKVATEPHDDMLRAVLANVRQSMKRDRKVTGLKKLQGLIWEEGYQSGQLKSQMYDDAIEAFERWTSQSYKLYIYSSGSIAAQRLLFGYTMAGDLTKYLSGYFDTTSGPKVDSQSYKTIAQSIGVLPSNVLFLTDNVKETKASLEAGMLCCIADRPGNATLSEDDREVAPVVTNFKQVDGHLK